MPPAEKAEIGERTEDAELLRRYAFGKSEAAFAELVRRQLDLVYSVALRQVGGDTHLAEDVTQVVFTALARKAASLAERPVLGGWLYRTAQFSAIDVVRAERRRRVREQEAQTMQEILNPPAGETDWDKFRPALDQAIGELKDDDRDAVVLRFFEGKSFAAVGARLRLSENSARMRVERALDKLHKALARRGVTSTAGALGLVLASQKSVAAPAGLAAHVVTDALGNAATVSGGIAAGASILRLMSTTKLAGGLIAALVLCASVTGNVYLLSRGSRPSASEMPVAAVPDHKSAPTPEVPVDALTGDVVALRDRLRAAGVSEVTIRSVIEGVLRRRYREKLSMLRDERLKTAWWRERDISMTSAISLVRPTAADDPKLFREMVQDPLDRLLGPDPVEVAEMDARYRFLPDEVRREFARVDKELAWLKSLDDQASYDGTKTLRDRQKADLEATRRELVAALTSEQHAEYVLHYGPLAPMIAQRMGRIDGTEAEYRAMFEIVEAKVKSAPAMSELQTQALGRQTLDQQMAQQIVAALGYDRALDYIWSGAYEFPAYARVVREGNLPISTSGRVLQLMAETAERASAIHYDLSLAPDQKRAAMVALQQKAQLEFDGLLPAAVQQKLAPESLAWLKGLNQGSYKFVITTLGGNAGNVRAGGSPSIDAPISTAGGRRIQVVPRRAAGG